jgi:hypothetical protein
MYTILSLLVVMMVAGCSNAATAPHVAGRIAHSEVRVVNATADPLVFFAVAADLAPLLDPVPETSVTAPWAQPLASGASRALVELPGSGEAPQDGVAVYLYALTPEKDRAQFTRVELVSGTAIRRAGNRIIIRQLRP